MSDEELAAYELAFHLKMPVYQLVEEMPYTEFVMWLSYMEQRPVEWRDDLRTYRLLQAQGVKERAENLFATLSPIFNPVTEDPMRSLKGSFLYKMMGEAKNGDKLQF